RKESERKKVEAEGIGEFQTIVSQGISDSYLRWRGIEATLQLSQSTNSKVVIIGGGKDGVPIILGNVDSPPPTAEKAPPTEGDKPPRPTAATPAVAAEKTPAANLTEPSEKTPPVTTPEVPRALFPFPLSVSHIQTVVSRLSGISIPTGSGTAAAPTPK